MKTSITACAAVLLLAAPAFAATTGQVQITGNVPIACDLTINEEPGASNIGVTTAAGAPEHIPGKDKSKNKVRPVLTKG